MKAVMSPQVVAAVAAASTTEAKIAALKLWAEENYERGADTFVECYDDADWRKMLDEHGGDLMQALETAERCADVYAERQADAAFYRSEAL